MATQDERIGRDVQEKRSLRSNTKITDVDTALTGAQEVAPKSAETDVQTAYAVQTENKGYTKNSMDQLDSQSNASERLRMAHLVTDQSTGQLRKSSKVSGSRSRFSSRSKGASNKSMLEAARVSLLAKRAEAYTNMQYSEEQEELEARLLQIEEEEAQRKLEEMERNRKFEQDRQLAVQAKREIDYRLKRLAADREVAIIESQLKVYDNISTSSESEVFVNNIQHVYANVKVKGAAEQLSKPLALMLPKETVNVNESKVPDIRLKDVTAKYYPDGNTASDCPMLNVCRPNVTKQSETGVMMKPEFTLAIVNELINSSRLPNISLNVFDGYDIIQYTMWRNSFECVIETATEDPVRRLTYLNQYTAGAAQLLIKGFMCKPTAESYIKAKAVLDKQYGNNSVLARAYMNQIDAHKAVSASDVNGLQSFSNLLSSTLGAMSSLEPLQQLNMDLALQKIILKLPGYMQASWRKQVFDSEENRGETLDFSALVKFVERELAKARHPVFSAQALNAVNPNQKGINSNENNSKSSNKTIKVLFTGSDQSSNEASKAAAPSKFNGKGNHCLYCDKLHHCIDKCRKFLALTNEERQKVVKEKRLCFSCLKHTSRDHTAKTCNRPLKCETCAGKHPTSLHRPKQKALQLPPAVNSSQPADPVLRAVSCAINSNDNVSNNKVLMSTVLVNIRLDNKIVQTYAALDSLSSACFVSRDLWNELGSKGEPVQISVKTINNETKQSTMMLKDLYVSSAVGGPEIPISHAYVQSHLAIDNNDLITHDDLCRFPYLRRLIRVIPERIEGLSVGLLIGINCSMALEPLECIYSEQGGPTAIKTRLGWVVSGSNDSSVDKSVSKSVKCNLLSVNDSCLNTSESVSDMLKKLYETDFIESVYVKNDNSVTSVYEKGVLQKPYSYNVNS